MLERYGEKRDFSKTPEPKPEATGGARGALRFVVQKHAARRTHYDFRLELDGALKSWAVPNGPSPDPKDKRLAVLVEDHPIDYGTFEGVIPKGSYGAGRVIVWDHGLYSPDGDGRLSFHDRSEAEARLRDGFEKGKLSITLRGRKMRGSWTLVRTKKDWLLIKHRDAFATEDAHALDDDRSTQSGLTLDDLKAGRLPDPARADPTGAANALGRRAAFPANVKPMLASLADAPFSKPGWLFEPKLDGFRALVLLRHGEVMFKSRNGNDLTPLGPEAAAELAALPHEQLVLDGELVALDREGRPDFGLLQQSLETRQIAAPRAGASIVYYPFDLLYVDGADLRRAPLYERKALLRRIVPPGDRVRPVEYMEEEGEVFFEAALRLGFEGAVAKARDSRYESGTRSRAWLKVKAETAQEFVIGGYTPGAGARAATFGALVLGYYEGEALRYAGRAGTGFDDDALANLRSLLDERRTEPSPFQPDAELDQLEARWVRPDLVAQVKFSQWTHDHRLRAPVFVALRSDVDPGTVVRETPEPVTAPASQAPSPPESAGNGLDDVLAQLANDRPALTLDLEGHRLKLTNLDKPLWPGHDGRPPITKGDMFRYYARMSPFLIPHLRDRPLTLTRYPNGVDAPSFYQKRWAHPLPEFVETARFFSSHNEGDVENVMVNNLPTLIWLAQLADIEMHPWLSRVVTHPDAEHLSTDLTGSEEAVEASVLNYPDFIVFDLDPYIYSGREGAGDEPELNRKAFAKTAEVARALRDVLDEMALSSFLKTSGKTGLHIYVPIERRYDYTLTRKTCETIGRFLLRKLPRDLTMEWSISKRSGKIFLDHNQNVRGKNMASIYSLRPLPGASVSTPLRWEELDDVYPTAFTIDTVPARVDALGDLWAGILDARHDLRRLLERDG